MNGRKLPSARIFEDGGDRKECDMYHILRITTIVYDGRKAIARK
jgi:hypothetical protein